MQRKVVSPNDFTSRDQIDQRLAAFEQRHNGAARPFNWKFTPNDLDDLLARIERHEQEQTPTTPWYVQPFADGPRFEAMVVGLER